MRDVALRKIELVVGVGRKWGVCRKAGNVWRRGKEDTLQNLNSNTTENKGDETIG